MMRDLKVRSKNRGVFLLVMENFVIFIMKVIKIL